MIEGPGWIQLDRCCKHHEESHDTDASKYLTYDQMIAIAHNCSAAVSCNAPTQYANGLAIGPTKKYSSSFDSEHVLSCPHVKSTVDCSAIARNHDQRFFRIPLSFVQNKAVCLIGCFAQWSEWQLQPWYVCYRHYWQWSSLILQAEQDIVHLNMTSP